ncbi:MAG: undecaprenyldiphospho-muramoylpentapeptide beta-N-acetylglucosaminyltransferase [Aquificota bacterium]|nr:MAG: undecaprenyldiphospho-muramoylpentapeptide beta-N-acetylglucosaminyltransferase [Aquificota bacterium]
MRVYVAGGGTGGHFFPALAFLECIKEEAENTYFVGSQRGIEFKLKDTIPSEKLFVPAQPFMGRSIRDKLIALYQLTKGTLLTYRKLKEGVSLVFGGYASVPLGIASLLKALPLFLHEQNSVPSQTNRLLGRFAKKVFITFEYTRRFFPSEKVLRVGLPIRKRLLEGLKLSRGEALKRLGLEDEFTLLVVGGSQGASFLNRLAVELFSKTGWQGVHITGEREFEDIKNFYRERRLRVLALPFTQEMEVVYKACHVAISRAGASTLSELSLYRLPALLIPFPHAVYDHQYYNAKELEELGGALTLVQKEASLERVLSLVEALLRDREKYAEKISTFANPFACQDMWNYIKISVRGR